MEKILKTSFILLAGAALATACGDDEMDVKFTDKGPQMEVVSCDQAAFMGDSVRFSVRLNDEFPLSTLKAELLYDETSVSDVTIRTKENGTYTAAVAVPLYAEIPDGVATVRFRAQNTGLGITEATADVAVSRPNPEYLTLTVGGNRYRMGRVSDYNYEVVGDFPASAPGTIETAPLDEAGHTVKLGWGDKALSAGSSSEIPFSMSKAGTYKITADLFNLTASPFGSLGSTLSESNTSEVINLIQGGTIDFPGIAGVLDWNLDYDFFKVNDDNTVSFKAVDGLYKLTADFASKFIKVEAMKDESSYLTFDADKAEGAIWCIGSGVGKPTVGPSWNTDDGAWCMSEIEDKKYQITFIAGESVSANSYDFKFFRQKGWGGEFGSYASVKDGGLIAVTSSGNIQPKDGVSLEPGQAYSFVIDVTGGTSAAVFSVEKADIPVATLDIKVNGVQAKRISSTHYLVEDLPLTKGGSIGIEGISMADLMKWYLDPDYLYFDATGIHFNAVDGKFDVDLYLEPGYATFRRQNSAGEDADIDDGALWLMAWGLANPSMDKQFAWNPGSAFCLAEVSPLVYQFTGKAVGEKDTTIGGRFRYDYVSGKYFGQNGWGRECGKIFDSGVTNTVELKGLASTLFKLTDSNNFELADGQQLEEGATYVLTIDLSKAASDKVETISLEKK